MRAEEQPFVSVLTPVYNGEKYIEECIESVLAQKYTNWEYVIVNNCSTDGTPSILQKYAALDKRIKIHNNEEFLRHLENGNKAFQLMSEKSKYCKVVHADDWLFPECILKMVEIGEEYPSTGIISSYRLAGSKVNLDGLPYRTNFVSGRDIARGYLIKGEFYFGSPTSLLIRSKYIRKRKNIYNQSFIHSDIAACLDILKESDFGFVHRILTFTRRHEQSVTNTIAKKNETYQLERLHNLVNFGDHYLSEEEYSSKFEKREDEYYEGMARKFIMLRSINLLKKGCSEIKNLSLSFKPLKFSKHIGLVVLRGVFLRIYIFIWRL